MNTEIFMQMMEVLTRHNLMKDLMFLTITWNLVNGRLTKHKLSK